MSTELQISQPQGLEAVLRLTDVELFTTERLSHALDLLVAEAGPLVADVGDEQGRREINRVARAVGGAITRLDERRRAYVAILKAQPKAIDDLFRVTFRQPAEALKERIRQPLTLWEEEMRAAEAETSRLIEILNAPVEHGTTAAAIQVRLDAAEYLELPDWLTPTQRGAVVAAMDRNIPRLKAALDAAILAEEQAAELARLREAERAAELKAARTAAAEEANQAAAARIQAAEHTAQQANHALEQAMANQRQAPATPTTANSDQRALVHRAILADLEDLGVPTELGKRLITAIARGQVFHLVITY